MDQSEISSLSMSNDFCNDIIIDILSRLPVESLIRFKSVSKFWFSLITSPRFAKLHQDHHQLTTATATATQSNNPTVLFIGSEYYCLRSIDKIVSLSSSSSSPNDFDQMEKINYPFNFPNPSYKMIGNYNKIIGSCNGLICIYILAAHKHVRGVNREFLCLWNPSTKEFKLLPSHIVDRNEPVASKFPIKNSTRRYGFGYDHVTNDYKVISSVQTFGKLNHVYMYHNELKLYTVGTNSWRTIQGTHYEREVYTRDASNWSYVNGAFHRIARLPDVHCITRLPSTDLRILSFDIVEEVYREVPKPDWLNERYEWELTVLRGCLCLWACKWCSIIEVWIMMDYGVKESWTKLFSTNSKEESYSYPLKPLWFCGNGEVVMHGVMRSSAQSRIAMYDTKRNELKWLMKWCIMTPIGPYLPSRTELFKGSLVSLESQKERKKELIC